MIKKAHKIVSDYSEAYIQAREVYNQAVKHIRANYKTDGELYKEAMKTAGNTLETAIKPICDECKNTVQDAFKGIKKAIQEIVIVPPSADVLAMLPLIKDGNLDETECTFMIQNHKNYIDRKLIYQAMGRDEDFTTVEEVCSALETLQNGIGIYLDTYHGEPLDRMSYHNANLIYGSEFDKTETLVNSFLTAYGNQNETQQ